MPNVGVKGNDEGIYAFACLGNHDNELDDFTFIPNH